MFNKINSKNFLFLHVLIRSISARLKWQHNMSKHFMSLTAGGSWAKATSIVWVKNPMHICSSHLSHSNSTVTMQALKHAGTAGGIAGKFLDNKFSYFVAQCTHEKLRAATVLLTGSSKFAGKYSFSTVFSFNLDFVFDV